MTPIAQTIRGEESVAGQDVWASPPETGAEVSATRTGAAPGAYVLAAREARVRTDSRSTGGQEIHAGELLLGALASCALSAVEAAAESAGVALRDNRVVARSERGATRPPRYAWFSLDFEIEGVSQTTAESLVESFLEICPIYGTLAAVSPVNVRVTAIP